jgi:uncharacterized protein (TIGR04222 family)
MKPEQQLLWSQLDAFQFDEPDARLTFRRRLARENRWSAEYTERVVGEYKRFVFLAMTAGTPMCPSDAVDQVWHMHLTYTRNYWDAFCGGVLGRPLHHGPTRGGRSEDIKHHDMYAATLAAYRTAFGEEPPADVWHSADVRFGDDVAFSRVNTRRNWVIPKPRWMRKAAMVAMAVLPMGAVGRLSPTLSTSIFDMKGPDFLAFFFLFTCAMFLIAVYIRHRGRALETATPAAETLDDVYAIATLNGGGTFAVNTAVVALVRRNLLEVDRSGGLRKVEAQSPPDDLHPFERAVYDGVQGTVCHVKEVRAKMTSWMDGMIDHLRSVGLVLKEASIALIQRRVFRLLMLIPLVGAVKIIIGLDRGRPVGFLVVGVIVASILIAVFLKKRPFRTRSGDAFLSQLQRQFPMPVFNKRNDYIGPTAGVETCAMMAALYGTSVFLGTDMNHLNAALNPSYTNNSGSGCSSAGCGGGGDGGGSSGCGGGGCGGCGGGGGD